MIKMFARMGAALLLMCTLVSRTSFGQTINETTAAAGLSGATTIEKRGEVQIFSVGLTGDGTASVSSVTLTISDLSAATGLVSGDFVGLKLYISTNATLDGNDTRIGSQSSVNIGSATTVSATTANTPPNGVQRFYIVSAVINSGATAGHAFKVGFAAGGVSTSGGGKGSAVTENDANKVTILSTTLKTPDFNADGSVNFSDFITLAGAFYSVQGGAGFNSNVDLNSDNRIDFADYLPFTQNFGNTTLNISLLRPSGPGANASAVPALDLDSSGNTADNGIRTGTVSGSGTTFKVQVFAKSLAVGQRGAEVIFNIDVSKVKVSSLTVPSGLTSLGRTDTSIAVGAFSSTSLPGDGLLSDVTFTTQSNVTNVPFTIGLKRFIITDTNTITDTLSVSGVSISVNVGLTPPTLVTANSTAFQRHLSITLDWSDVSSATSYTLEYANNSGFTGSTTVTGLTTSQYTLPSSPADGTYYWRVKAVGTGGSESSFSSANSFAIIPTFTEWTVILLAAGMMGYMVWYRRRRAYV